MKSLRIGCQLYLYTIRLIAQIAEVRADIQLLKDDEEQAVKDKEEAEKRAEKAEKDLHSLEERRERLQPVMDNVSKEIKEYGTVKTLLPEAGTLERATTYRDKKIKPLFTQMKKHIYDESNGLSHTLHGDYYLPDLAVNEEEPTYGKYGMLRRQFLKEHRSARYQYLLMTGELTGHLNQVDQEAREQVETLVKQMVEKQGVTEQLKMQDQMKWVGLMKNIKACAEEIVLKESVYM